MINQVEGSIKKVGLERFFNTILYILLMMFIASTVIFTSENTTIYGKLMDILFISFFILYNILYPQKTYYLNSIIIIYFIFLAYSLSSVFWTFDLYFTTFTAKRMLFVWINMVVIYNILKLYDMYSAIIFGLIIGVFFNVFLSFEIIDFGYELYGSEITGQTASIRYKGSTFQPNMLGGIAVFSIMGAMLIVHNAKSKFDYVIPILAVFSAYYLILLTISRASLVIGSTLMLIFLLRMFLNKSTRNYLVISFLFALVVLSYSIDLERLEDVLTHVIDGLLGLFGGVSGGQGDSSTSERLKLLLMAIQVFKENPFFGTGLDTMRVLLFDGLFAHNTYIELLASLGPIGFILYYSIHFVVIVNIFHVDDLWLKLYLLMFMGILLLGDFAGVSYYSKYVLIYLLLFNYMAEKNINGRKKEI